MSFGEIIVILVVAILVLGPDKLPEAIVQIAKILKAVKRNIDDAKSSIEKEIRINDLKKKLRNTKMNFQALMKIYAKNSVLKNLMTLKEIF